MEKIKLFIIVKKYKGEKVPIQAFIESNFEKAKEYFYGYTYGENELHRYELRWIGTYDNHTQSLKTNNIFITGGYENNAEMKEKKTKNINQLKFFYNKNKTYTEKVKEIFEGDFINEN